MNILKIEKDLNKFFSILFALFYNKKNLNLRIKMFWIEKLRFLPDLKWLSKTKNRNLIFWVIPGCKRVKNLSFDFVLKALRYIAFCLNNNYQTWQGSATFKISIVRDLNIYKNKTACCTGKPLVTKSRLVLALHLIGWERIENSGPITKQREANRTPAQTSYDSL